MDEGEFLSGPPLTPAEEGGEEEEVTYFQILSKLLERHGVNLEPPQYGKTGQNMLSGHNSVKIVYLHYRPKV